jgi:eukaryotic-like serine/threonine-protein kinase
MPTKIGHFEILSELSKTATGAVYKANDPESGQTVALKAIQLSAFGDGASDLQTALLQEAENTKCLSSSNITPVFGAGEMEGQFCAAMEYVQGNSIATMIARKEGFSIWDLLDIGRQVCAGLEHAHSNNVFHYSLEPSKIMCGWDGTVKILSFGVSSVGKFAQHLSEGVPSFVHYMSPEQVLGEALDGRSNLFSLGVMFYEMVTDRKAFDREDAESLRQSILESTPVPPLHANPKLHPQLSDLIMKALDKDPAKRYQRCRELLDDLEKCKESKPQAAKKPAAPTASPVAPAVKPAVQAKAAAAVAPKPKVAAPAASSTIVPAAAVARPVQPKASSIRPPERKIAAPAAVAPKVNVTAAPAPKAAAAAVGAGWSGGDSTSPSADVPELDLSNQFITSCVKATIETASKPSASMSSAVVEEPDVETFAPDAPKIAVDPMMAEGGPAGRSGSSFSEISELPPLKEVYIEPTRPAESTIHAAQTAPPPPTIYEPAPEVEEKPKVQPREVAKKAIKEIKGVPPKLMLYSIIGAVALIIIIVAAIAYHIHSLNGDDDSGAQRSSAVDTSAQTQPAPSQPAAQSAPAPVPVQQEPVATAPEPPTHSAAAARGKNKKKTPPPAPAIVPGQMVVDSTPQGAQVQVDGRSDASWVTPFTVSNLQPGQHSLTVSKPGYSTDTRTVAVNSGAKASLVVHLAQLMAVLAVNSNPPGANVYVDGRDMGKMTPAQVSVEKGNHVVLVRKAGYIDETTTAQFVLGQTISFAPTMRPLGNVDSIKTVGKMKKLFGGNGAQAGMATVSIRTQPKGAQVAINQHILDKSSPVEVQLEPGNYVIDITLSGYAPIHKVITADKGGKAVVDETMQPQ